MHVYFDVFCVVCVWVLKYILLSITEYLLFFTYKHGKAKTKQTNITQTEFNEIIGIDELERDVLP